MKLDRGGGGWLAVLAVGVGLFVGGQAAAQGQEAPLRVMRAASLERQLLVMPSDVAAAAEAYVDDVLIRVVVEEDFRVYEALHDGVKRTLHVPLDAPLGYVAFDTERNQFEPLEPGLRVEMDDYGLLEGVVAAAGRHGRQGVSDAGVRHRAAAAARQSGGRRGRHRSPAGRNGRASDAQGDDTCTELRT